MKRLLGAALLIAGLLIPTAASAAKPVPTGTIEIANLTATTVSFTTTTDNVGSVSHDGKVRGHTWVLVLVSCDNGHGQLDYVDATFPLPLGPTTCTGKLILYPDGIDVLAETEPFEVG